MEQRKTVDSKTEVKSMENKKIKVALLGLGTVGGGVYKLIQRRSESMIHTVGAELEVEKILVHSLHNTSLIRHYYNMCTSHQYHEAHQLKCLYLCLYHPL